jgi:outer membrane lipase/esterase
MTGNWLRRAVLVAACASAVLVAGCGGGGKIESALSPTRIVSLGDGFSDVGSAGSRYTVNDGGNNVWTLQVAAHFGLSLTPATTGGTGYARGNARVTAKPDAAGNAATPTVSEQVDAFLAAGGPGAADIVLINGGFSDIIAEVTALNAGTQTDAATLANVQQAGRDLGAQVRRLTQAGGKYVVVSGVYNLGRSPWSVQGGQGALLQDLSIKFNEALLVSIVDLGSSVLYADSALYFNLVTSTPGAYSFVNATEPVCTSVDPGPGIGLGAGQVNSSLCDTSTVGGNDYAVFVFADRVYLAPRAAQLWGDEAYRRIRERW